MEKIKKAAIYARFSSNNQREESIDAQLRVCRKYAADHEITVVKEYTDSALSGRTDQRPAFQRMIRESANREFDTLLIYSHDRFSRDKYDTAIYKSKLKRNGVRVISATMPLDDSPEAGLMESIMEGFAQYYSENLARSTKRGLEENALNCKSNGGLPIGYRSEKGTLVIEPVGAKVVQIVFEMYADGIGKKAICDYLNGEGFRTNRGHLFRINSLTHILANERYTGVYMYDGVRTDGGLPAIISKELFETAQKTAQRHKRSHGAPRGKEEYILSGKAFCGRCGKPLVGESGTSHNGELYKYYKCSARKKDPKKCCKAAERKEDLESFVVDYIRRNVLTDEMIEEIAQKEYELLDQEAQDKCLLAAYQAQYKDVSEKIENLLQAIEAGIFTTKTKDRLQELENQQSLLEDKIVREQLKKPTFTKDHIIFWLESFRNGKIDDFAYKRTVINHLVNAVFVYDNEKKDNDKKIVIVLSLRKNTAAFQLPCSNVQKMVKQFDTTANYFFPRKYLVAFSAIYYPRK